MTDASKTTGAVIVLSGPETFLLREYVRQYFRAAEQKYGELNVSKIDPAEMDFSALKNELLSPPFFGGGKRVFFLDEFPFVSKGQMSEEKKNRLEQITTLLEEIPEDVVVICITENPDKRQKAWKDLTKKADAKNSRSFESLDSDALTQWIREHVAKKGGKILPAAAEHLWKHAGKNLWTLDQEIRKLIAYCEEKPISERDIETVTDAGYEAIQFALSNAFSSGKETEVLRVFHDLVASGENATAILYRDFASVLRQLILVQYALENKKSAADIEIHPFVFSKMQKTAAAFSSAHLQKMYERLTQIDEAAKTGGISGTSSREDLLIFALERWIQDFFAKTE